jgi:leucine dehydrogenase
LFEKADAMTKHPSYRALSRYARMLGFGDIHTKIDKETGLHAIIAVHNTALGPAIGGCRFYDYSCAELALEDALRLAYGMTLKAAACGLPHGGGKAVILKPKGLTADNRKALFQSFGDFVHTLNGRYVTAMDVGVTVDDMTTILERTPYVIGARGPGRIDQDPAPSTARGIFCAIRAGLAFTDDRTDYTGLTIAIQGAGHVGLVLAKHCLDHGMRVFIADVNPDATARAAQLGATVVAPDKIETVDCDIYSPCALGGTITHDFIAKTTAKMIAGCANNQLAHHSIAHLLQEKNIVYLPDFLINSGGLINAAMTYAHQNLTVANQKIDEIYDVTLQVLARAAASKKTTARVAEDIAFERLKGR